MPGSEKKSMRSGCKAEVKVKLNKKEKCWYFDHVVLEHNHQLFPSPRMVRYMHAHKQRDKGILNLINIMSRNGVPYQNAMNVMSELHGGRQNCHSLREMLKTYTC